ncbi:outer membrane lipoprotein-sorting protein [Desmospora activa]|uniref:Outer membrane lipoprotein-sorting protein n=1 Tax=Desmospora activa DSM 45169 TaxID=1121389 RepID=A0A2T4Z0N0_9BACL|nr:outer membrane lipoprotein-sorting protein [Desmospora activa]PTM53308.1 outer membrane lipoprotein-sorting protein [Desmospora activa DSM 45169]
MRRITWVCVVLLSAIVFLAGCGEKTPEEIVSDLSKRSEKMESYKSKGTMTINSGTAPQEYKVEVWFKKPHFYRVSLTNTKKDVTQILLRNDEGVFVLTPHLEKSFRFQSDWPENSGQVYLYESLLNSIIDDSTRKVTPTEKQYQFEVAANYPQNQSLVSQQIWMDRKYNPQKVQVLNDEEKVMVEVQFDSFEADTSFDKDAFDMERNMTGFAGRSVPTLAKDKDQDKDQDEDQDKDKEQETAEEKPDNSLDVFTPDYIPEGYKAMNETTVETPDGPAVITRYQGEKPFTLTQRQPVAVEASAPVYGKPVDLGYTVGILLERDGKKHLSWTYEGTELELIGALPEEELLQVAESVYGQAEEK